MTSSSIKAVFFDVGSTLIDPCPDINGTFYSVARDRGHDVGLNEITRHLESVNKFYEEEYLRDGDFWCSPTGSVEIYLEMYRYLAHLVGLGDDCEEIAHAVNAAYQSPKSWMIYDDVIGCLSELKRRRYTLAIVSNWSPNLLDLMRGLKLAPYFDEIISSADVGYRKPDPMIFTLTLERLKLQPEEVIHVGDRPDADGEGAKASGITPCIIDRFGYCKDAEFARISSLAELCSFITSR